MAKKKVAAKKAPKKKELKLKTYNVTYRCEMKRTCTVEAHTEAEAREKVLKEDFEDDGEVYRDEVDDICVSLQDPDEDDDF